MRSTFALCGLVASALSQEISIVSFDGTPATTFKFEELNDPVMGGESSGTWSVNTTGQYGVMDGKVVDVPKLSAPGFIKAAADGKFPDISAAIGGDLILRVRSRTDSYAGFRVSFASGTMAASYACAGGGSIPLSRGCYKTKFTVPAGYEFVPVRIPFSSFSDLWSPSTGEQTKSCAEDKSACPTAQRLSSISRFEVWAEGADGDVRLEVQSISAAPPALFGARKQQRARPPTTYDTCSGPVQDNLRFGVSGRTEPTVPVAVSEDESLADAVCCDSRVLPFAEPQFLFEAPDIQLYSHMGSGVTTFYDSVCGVPLFRTPVNRTLTEFQEDTNEHGWPSFRSAEVVTKNVKTDFTTGYVTSVCGTHLGSYLPDAEGPRWCIDLSCVSGQPKE